MRRFHETLLAARECWPSPRFTQITLIYRQLWALQLGESIIHDLRNSAFEHLQKMPMSYYAKTKTGRVDWSYHERLRRSASWCAGLLFVTLVQLGQMIGSAARWRTTT